MRVLAGTDNSRNHEMLTRWLLPFVIGGAALSVIPLVVRAQTDGKVLRGITKVRVIIEDLSDDATKCGFDKDSILRAALFPLSSSHLQVVSGRGTDAFVLYLNVNALAMPEVKGCAYNALMELSQPQFIKTTFGEKFLNVMYWNNGRIGAGPRGEVGRELAVSLDALTKQFLIDWNLDQK
jgi:hypothetical protein